MGGLYQEGSRGGGEKMCLDSGCVCCRWGYSDFPQGLDVGMREKEESGNLHGFWSQQLEERNCIPDFLH